MGIERPILLDLPAEWAGERIMLRRWREEDAAALFAMIAASRERLARWFPWPARHRDIDDTRALERGQPVSLPVGADTATPGRRSMGK